ncbi:MAG: leucine-rich repeat domain-containing protein [Bacteroidaceae bacterium]|nr:leucine-rich repeat domain-containing protein [Bacteroidaceae bacterium]
MRITCKSKWLAALLLPLAAVSANAYDFVENHIYYDILDDTSVEVTYGLWNDLYSGDVVIPATTLYKNVTYNVTSIGAEAFLGCYDLNAVILPESVTNIGSGAFSGCYNIAEMTVAEGNTVYDSRDGCNAIIETETNTLICGFWVTTIPQSVTAIGKYAFQYCMRPLSINIPEGVTSIGNYAFQYCMYMTSITIPQSMMAIGEYAFYGCTGLADIYSRIKEPFEIKYSVFGNTQNGAGVYKLYNTVTLHVPIGCKALYEEAEGWKLFANIVEFDASDVKAEESPEVVESDCYDLLGRNIGKRQPGLNVVRTSDGNVRKVMVR